MQVRCNAGRVRVVARRRPEFAGSFMTALCAFDSQVRSMRARASRFQNASPSAMARHASKCLRLSYSHGEATARGVVALLPHPAAALVGMDRLGLVAPRRGLDPRG